MGKARHRASKNDIVLREFAPQRFGFENIESVQCFYCDIVQYRTLFPRGNGTTQSVRFVHGHHIYPLSSFPEMAHSPENYVFLCEVHHTEFHKTYDKHEKWPNPRYNPKKQSRQENNKYIDKVTPGSIDNLQEYLGLTAKETIAHQLGWTQAERDYAHIEDGYFADQELGKI